MINNRIGEMMNMATRSGKMSARRFGIKSANKMNKTVDVTKDNQKPLVAANSASGVHIWDTSVKNGVKKRSPKIPPANATALIPI